MTRASDPRQQTANRAQALANSIDLRELLQVIGIDDRTRAQGLRLAAIIDQHGEALFSKFYERISHISFAYKFRDDEVDTLKKKQFDHWKYLFTCNMDANYVRNAAIIGDVHRQKGIEPLLYIVGYSIIKSSLMDIIASADMPPADKGRLMVALEKYISLDVGLAMVGYSGHKAFARLFAPGFSG
jgi:hypothetical protein